MTVGLKTAYCQHLEYNRRIKQKHCSDCALKVGGFIKSYSISDFVSNNSKIVLLRNNKFDELADSGMHENFETSLLALSSQS